MFMSYWRQRGHRIIHQWFRGQCVVWEYMLIFYCVCLSIFGFYFYVVHKNVCQRIPVYASVCTRMLICFIFDLCNFLGGHLWWKYWCHLRCLWEERRESGPPPCVYPDGRGYRMVGVPSKTRGGVSVLLERINAPLIVASPAFSKLRLSVEYHTRDRLRLKVQIRRGKPDYGNSQSAIGQ